MGEKSNPQDLCFIRSQQSSGENTRAEFLRKSLLPLDQDLVGAAVAAQSLFDLLPKSRCLPLISCCFSLLGAARSGFVTAHPFRTASPPLCCQEMQVRQSCSTPNSLWKTLLSSSPVNLSINRILLIPLFFVL